VARDVHAISCRVHGGYFVQRFNGTHIEEWDRRPNDAEKYGRVVGCRYMPVRERSTISRWAFWRKEFWRPPRVDPTWRLPFTEAGGDALDLFGGEPPALGNEPGEGVVEVRGVARALPGATTPLWHDSWFDGPAPWRVAQGADFLVEREDDAPVVLSCGMAPLIVAVPAACESASVLPGLPSEARRRCPTASSHRGWQVVLEEGASVIVRGVARPLTRSVRNVDVGGYRDAPRRPALVVSDEDGVRLVVRVVW